MGDNLFSVETETTAPLRFYFNRTNELARSRIREAMELLTARERWILERRVLADTECTLESLGQKLGISKERVRQIEARALQKLCAALHDLAA